MHRKIIVLSVITFFVCGCALPTSPQNLEIASRDECIVLSERAFWREPRGMVGLTWEEGLTSGVYKAEFEDSEGIFFRGSGRPVWQRAFPTSDPESAGYKAGVKEGGIWVPSNPIEKPKIYYYFEAQPHTVDDINTYTMTVAVSSVNQGVGIGPSSVGAAVGGAVINAMIEADVGNIYFFPEINDHELVYKIRNVGPCPVDNALENGL